MPWTVRRQIAGFGILLGIVLLTVVASPSTAVRLVESTVDDPARFAVALVLLYLVRPAVAVPTMAAAAVVGYGYGIAVGLPVALLGTTLSSIPPYYAGRYLYTTDGPLGRWCATGEGYFTIAGDTRGIVAARVAPVPSDAVSYTAGLSRVRLGPYLLGTIIGELHWTAIAVIAGASARRVTAGGLDVVSPAVVLIAAAGAALIIGRPLYRYLTSNAADPTA